jgi:hypothetical protein
VVHAFYDPIFHDAASNTIGSSVVRSAGSKKIATSNLSRDWINPFSRGILERVD